MSPVISHPKKRGEWVELQFMARATQHGLTVSRPWGDSARYDFVVESAGRFFRVQVKSTTAHAQRGSAYLCNTISRGPTGKIYDYRPADVDFFAFYIIPEDIWYIVPVREATRCRFAIYLNPYERTNRWFRFMEAWPLLSPPSQSAGRKRRAA